MGPYTLTPWLSILIPTIGRQSLECALASIRSQEFDHTKVEILVIGDTANGTWSDWLEELRQSDLCRRYGAWYYEHDGDDHSFGAAQLNAGMQLAMGDWMAFLGDDDEYLPGAIQAIEHATAEGARPMIFKSEMKGGFVLWRDRALMRGGVSGQNIVTPRQHGKIGHWSTDVYEGDYEFIRSTVDLWGGDDAIEWREEILSRCH